MEVHHHPNVEKKGLKEYLLEGLMIFIAVTMGFFAESLREHISDREKADTLVVSLMADLKNDTAKMDEYFAGQAKRMANYKLLFSWLEKPVSNTDTAFRSRFYKAAWSTMGRSGVHFTNRAINQLKNGDYFRLITNRKVADAITDYSNNAIACDAQLEVVEHFTRECSKPALQMINLKAYHDHIINNTIKIYDNTVPFRSIDPKTLLDYSNAIYLKAAVESNYLQFIKRQEQQARMLIGLLHTAYHAE